MSDQRIIGDGSDDGPGGSTIESRNIFLLAERDQSESFAYLFNDAYAFRPSDTRPNWQASERRVDLAERAKRTEIAFPRFKE